MDEGQMDHLGQFVVQADVESDWRWEDGQLGELAARLPKSHPGPDGLPYAFWAQAPPGGLRILDEAAQAMSQGAGAPEQMMRSFTLFLPTGEFGEEAGMMVREVADTRRITLMQTSLKLIATVCNRALACVAKRTVCGEQRGFVVDRVMGDNLVEVEGAMQELSITGRTPACSLLDFMQAFPSLAHAWMFRVLQVMRLCVYVASADGARHVCRVGDPDSPHGCAAPAAPHQSLYTLYVVAVDPLVRAYLAQVTLESARLALFADDVAVVMPELAEALRPLFELLARWRAGAGPRGRRSRRASATSSCWARTSGPMRPSWRR